MRKHNLLLACLVLLSALAGSVSAEARDVRTFGEPGAAFTIVVPDGCEVLERNDCLIIMNGSTSVMLTGALEDGGDGMTALPGMQLRHYPGGRMLLQLGTGNAAGLRELMKLTEQAITLS